MCDCVSVTGFYRSFWNIFQFGYLVESQVVVAFQPHGLSLFGRKGVELAVYSRKLIVYLPVGLGHGDVFHVVYLYVFLLTPPVIVGACVAYAPYHIPVDVFDVLVFLHLAEHRHEHLLYYIFGVFTPPDAHICKSEQPVLPFGNEALEPFHVLFAVGAHLFFGVRCFFKALLFLQTQRNENIFNGDMFFSNISE